MRKLAVFMLCISLFAVTWSRDIHKKYADQDDEGALLDAFVRAVEAGKIDINNLVMEKSGDLKKRWWWTPRNIIFPVLPSPGKK